MLRRVASLTLASLLLAPLFSASPPDPWLRMRSANFELLTTAGERNGRDILRQFERVHSFFALVFGSTPPAAKPVRLIAFRTQKEFAKYRPNEVAAAYFQPGYDHDSIVMTAEVTDNRGVAVHEYTHLMVHQIGRKYPIWFNEGLAELYSNLESQGDQVMVGRPIPSRVASLTRDRWIGVGQLIQVRHDSPLYNEKAQAGMFYAESWLLAHMLNLSPDYQPGLKGFIAALTENDAGEAFRWAYGKSIEQVDADLQAYLSGGTLRAALLAVQLPKNADAPAVESGHGFEARLALAALLADTPNKRPQSREAYEELTRDYPKKWVVEAGWGEFYWRERDFAQSAAHFAKALEFGCKDPRVYVAYGRILNYAGRDKEALATLRAALDLDRDSKDAHLELGIALVRTGDAKGAIEELSKLPAVTGPEAPRYFYNLAYAYYRAGDAARARASLEKGRPYVKTPQDRNAFDSLTAGLNARDAAQAAAGDRQLKLAQRETPPPARENEVTPPPAPNPETTKEAPPKLVRRQVVTNPDGTVSTVSRSVPSTEGELTQFDCKGKAGILHVRVAGIDTLFTIDDPLKVIVRSGLGAPVQFNCGAQNGQRVKVDYEESRDAAGGIVRIVRTLDFQ